MIWTLFFIQLYLSIISSNVSCYVLFAANIEDFRSLAKKIIPNHLADQLADMASKSAINYRYDSKKDLKVDTDSRSEENLKYLPKTRYVIKNQHKVEDVDLDELVKRVKEKLYMENPNNDKVEDDGKILKYVKEISLDEGERPNIDDYYYKDEAMNIANLDYVLDKKKSQVKAEINYSTSTPEYEAATESAQYDSQQKIDTYYDDENVKILNQEYDQDNETVPDGINENNNENIQVHLYSKENEQRADENENGNPTENVDVNKDVEYEYIEENDDLVEYIDEKTGAQEHVNSVDGNDDVKTRDHIKPGDVENNNEDYVDAKDPIENDDDKPEAQEYADEKVVAQEYVDQEEGAQEYVEEKTEPEKYVNMKPKIDGKYIKKPESIEYDNNDSQEVAQYTDEKPEGYDVNVEHSDENSIVGHFDGKNTELSIKRTEKPKHYDDANEKNGYITKNDKIHKDYIIKTTPLYTRPKITQSTTFINIPNRVTNNYQKRKEKNEEGKKASGEVKEVPVYYDDVISTENTELLKQVDLRNIKDSYEDYITPKKENNIFESEETTQRVETTRNVVKLVSSEPKFVYQKAKIDVTNQTEFTTKSTQTTKLVTKTTKPELEIKAKTESLWYDDSKIEETPQSNDTAVTKPIKKLKGTMIPTREYFKMSSPNYISKIKAAAEKYNFDEPLPEKDREHENIKDIANPSDSINRKVKLKF